MKLTTELSLQIPDLTPGEALLSPKQQTQILRLAASVGFEIDPADISGLGATQAEAVIRQLKAHKKQLRDQERDDGQEPESSAFSRSLTFAIVVATTITVSRNCFGG